jgi:hypothetical protein
MRATMTMTIMLAMMMLMLLTVLTVLTVLTGAERRGSQSVGGTSSGWPGWIRSGSGPIRSALRS